MCLTLLVYVTVIVRSRADPGFFLGGGVLVSCSTSTPYKPHSFFLAEYQLYQKTASHLRGGGRSAHPLHPPPRSAPVGYPYFLPYQFCDVLVWSFAKLYETLSRVFHLNYLLDSLKLVSKTGGYPSPIFSPFLEIKCEQFLLTGCNVGPCFRNFLIFF